MHPAVQAGLLVVHGLSGRRGRKLLLAAGGGTLLGLAAIAVFMVSAVGALLSVCQREAQDAASTAQKLRSGADYSDAPREINSPGRVVPMDRSPHRG